MNLANSFLFTEQDLPGFKSRSHGANSDLPPHLRRRQEQRPDDKTPQEGGVKKNKYQPRYRKAIPSTSLSLPFLTYGMVLVCMLTLGAEKTTLAGKFSREINCLPVWTDETKHILKTMADDAMKPKVSTSIVKSFDPSGVIQAGAHVANDKFSNLVVSVSLVNRRQGNANNSHSARLRSKRRTRSRRKRRRPACRRANCATASSSATTNTPTGRSKHSSKPCVSPRHGCVRTWRSSPCCTNPGALRTTGN